MDDLASSIADETYCGARHLHFTNAYSVVCASHDSAVADALQAGACYPDGLPLVWALSGLDRGGGWSQKRRVRGPDAFSSILQRTAGTKSGRHFLLGSTPEVLDRLSAVISERFPGSTVVGIDSPPFAPVEEVDWSASLRRIEDSDAALVWVGLGTPKQDLVAAKLSAADPDRLYLAVGAAFDFLAGLTPVAPKWIQRSGLEWLFRLSTEPRRLWRRYLIGNVEFILIVTKQWFHRKRRRA